MPCSVPPPLDEEEVREAVEALMLRRAPTALVRLVGKNAYARCDERVVLCSCGGTGLGMDCQNVWHTHTFACF